jgi:LysR family glycine cleavage system transcriptional activator
MPDIKQNLRALQAFEAVSRRLSISNAALELGVTQSAVSHHMRQLTEQVGERLLTESGRGVALTPAGAKLAARLQAAFQQIEMSVEETIGSRREIVRLAVCSSFGPGWLIPRLSRFYAANPSVDLQLRMYGNDPELTDTVADAFVTSYPTEKGFWSLKLQTELLVPVMRANAGIDPADGPLITTDLGAQDFAKDWRAFADICGIDIGGLTRGRFLQATHYVFALSMASAGLGIALVPDFLAAPSLACGELELLSAEKIPTHEDYFCA